MRYRLEYVEPDNTDALRLLFKCMKDNKVLDTVFYDGSVTSASSWIRYVNTENVWLIQGVNKVGVPCFCFWLTDHLYKTSRIHLCSWDVPKEDRKDVTSSCIRWVYDQGQTTGLVGITPSCYRHVVSLCKSVGFKEAGEFKNAVYFKRKDSFVAVKLLILDLGEHYSENL